jgi:hypothetical protein
MDSSDRLAKHLMIAFALALAIYAGFFAADRWMRSRKGPWEVSFQTNESGYAQIVINQPRLGIADTRITFSSELATNSGTVAFDMPKKNIPFGKTKFEDLTYLPGSVAFDFFGHEVELLPRTLYINKREKGWIAGTNYVLQPGEKLPPEMSYDPREKKRRRRN